MICHHWTRVSRVPGDSDLRRENLSVRKVWVVERNTWDIVRLGALRACGTVTTQPMRCHHQCQSWRE